jgi:DNA-binding IclR family transcriptional regulator
MKKPNNDKAVKQQKQANQQSQSNFKEQMKMMQKQMKQAEAVQLPTYEAPAPNPTRSSADVAAAGREMRMSRRRKYGFNQSVTPSGVQGMASGMVANNPIAMLGGATSY